MIACYKGTFPLLNVVFQGFSASTLKYKVFLFWSFLSLAPSYMYLEQNMACICLVWTSDLIFWLITMLSKLGFMPIRWTRCSLWII